MSSDPRDHRRPQSVPGAIKDQIAGPVSPDEEDTDAGGDREARIEKRVVNTDRSARAAFAQIKELKEDFKAHAALDKEALDEIRKDNKTQSALLTDLRVTQAQSVTEIRAIAARLNQEHERERLRLIAAGEVQKLSAAADADTKKFEREHKSKWKIQLLAIVGAIAVCVIGALLGHYWSK